MDKGTGHQGIQEGSAGPGVTSTVEQRDCANGCLFLTKFAMCRGKNVHTLFVFAVLWTHVLQQACGVVVGHTGVAEPQVKFFGRYLPCRRERIEKALRDRGRSIVVRDHTRRVHGHNVKAGAAFGFTP